MQVALEQITEYWLALVIAAGVIAVAVYAYFQYRALQATGPQDATGNGINIGKAKAFDNRTLALRIERLSASLATLKVVNQRVTENLSTFQGQTSSESSRTLTLDVKPALTAGGGDGQAASEKKEGDGAAKPSAATSTEAARAEVNPTVGLAASDILNDQLNLASQILNLEVLYERSLTDRLFGDNTRLQTVLGFQVSITPPAGYEHCVAVAEVAVRVKNNNTPVSLVALIPQERTYNAQSVSSSAQSIGGSAVASVLTLGLGAKGKTRQLFIHRDSDTIAFEHDPRSEPTLFDDDKSATVFGWEFRPVLGRRTVTAGTRQMLAVVAVPAEDSGNPEEISLEIRTRSYWRRYNEKKQTSRRKWHLMPFKVDGSNLNASAVQELNVPNTAKIQDALEPRVTGIEWVNSGPDRATVIVKGANFFSGTKVVIGGKVHREEDSNLTLKSDQALEFETSITSLATGDAVLSGRFGSSFPLKVPEDQLPVEGLYIAGGSIKPSRYTKAFRVAIDVKGIRRGRAVDFTAASLTNLPNPILFVGTEPLPMPYDYMEINPRQAAGSGGTATSPPPGPSPDTAKFLRFEAWIPAKTLARNPSIAFRLPFCGTDYHASQPLSFSEPTITRMGGDKQKTAFRIVHPLGFAGTLRIVLDRRYKQGSPELTKLSDVDFKFEVPTDVVSKYQNLIVSIGTAEPYLLPIPSEEKPKPKTSVEATGKPPRITKGSLGPVEWSGTALDAITAVTLYTNPPAKKDGQPPDSPPQPVKTAAQFTAYEGGKRIEVYFAQDSTNEPGRAEVEFQIAPGETMRVPLSIVKDAT